jgi:hypothetical protein
VDCFLKKYIILLGRGFLKKNLVKKNGENFVVARCQRENSDGF